MEPAFENGHSVSSGVSTRRANSAHDGFGSRVGKPYLFNLRAQVFDLLNDFSIERRRKTG